MANDKVLTSKAVLAKLFELRKDYEDDHTDPTYLALHHASLFISYQIGAFESYLRDSASKTGDERRPSE